MKTKKAVSLILAALLSLSLCLPVAASEKKQPSYITNLIGQLQEVVDALEAVIAMLQGIGSDDDAAEAVEDAAAKVGADGFRIGQVWGEGMYRVGEDVPVGEYKITCTGQFSAFFYTYTNSTGDSDSMLQFVGTKSTSYFTVKADAKYFQIQSGTAEYLGPTE